MKHFAILVENESSLQTLITSIYEGSYKYFESLKDKKGGIFSAEELEHFIDREERHEIKTLTSNRNQSLLSMSSGERKKALLKHILSKSPEYLIVVNPFDNLDIESQADLKTRLEVISEKIHLIQLVSRLEDILMFTSDFFTYSKGELHYFQNRELFWKVHEKSKNNLSNAIPAPIRASNFFNTELVRFQGVSVSFDGKQILKNIDWTINKGEFWQLIGPNGSGKSTLLNMITGDSHKGYGQNLTLLGNKKGSGESVWDIKKHIGYFTPSMTDKFKGRHTLENMLVAGLHDSVGLYIKPTDNEKQLALKWLALIGLDKKKEVYFHQLSMGQKRLLMVARAMIKHPILLILDEPTVGLDDSNTGLFLALVNKIVNETESAIIYVSHRAEAGLNPQFIYKLSITENGSTGKIVYI
ncbi:ATP-binding cassette domain-containing protein [Croceitalea rosinachiae]|uniref:ATP-binding cassette domain-containing protein n=1 Tax=Croceitalea rosinachiae TaxID=3075596 RepID=A0ABU3AGR6_9FLAO|nr:ATP-binding cassette domain-containing protein [Croceitalea sp. F388]MDT0608086.1 ATP-binding cassette domain-containing protein [Croceitalea sp. F388]